MPVALSQQSSGVPHLNFITAFCHDHRLYRIKSVTCIEWRANKHPAQQWSATTLMMGWLQVLILFTISIANLIIHRRSSALKKVTSYCISWRAHIQRSFQIEVMIVTFLYKWQYYGYLWWEEIFFSLIFCFHCVFLTALRETVSRI